MLAEESPQDMQQQSESQDSQMQEPPTAPASMMAAGSTKKRPRLDLTVKPGQHKRGKSMFGILVGTLNKAKVEEKEKSASEAARKRQLLEHRLQAKLRKETDSVRRAEEAKKDKMSANRKEEELQLKDSIHKHRRTRYPLLANFLCTSDNIPSEDSPPPPSSSDPLTNPPRSHPPPLYYLPAILTPTQKAFLNRRKDEIKEAAEKEWSSFREERQKGIEDINQLRHRVAEEETRQRALKEKETETDKDAAAAAEMTQDSPKPANGEPELETNGNGTSGNNGVPEGDAQMDIDAVAEKGGGGVRDKDAVEERKEEAAPMQADDEDAVEY